MLLLPLLPPCAFPFPNAPLPLPPPLPLGLLLPSKGDGNVLKRSSSDGRVCKLRSCGPEPRSLGPKPPPPASRKPCRGATAPPPLLLLFQLRSFRLRLPAAGPASLKLPLLLLLAERRLACLLSQSAKGLVDAPCCKLW